MSCYKNIVDGDFIHLGASFAGVANRLTWKMWSLTWRTLSPWLIPRICILGNTISFLRSLVYCRYNSLHHIDCWPIFTISDKSNMQQQRRRRCGGGILEPSDVLLCWYVPTWVSQASPASFSGACHRMRVRRGWRGAQLRLTWQGHWGTTAPWRSTLGSWSRLPPTTPMIGLDAAGSSNRRFGCRRQLE